MKTIYEISNIAASIIALILLLFNLFGNRRELFPIAIGFIVISYVFDYFGKRQEKIE